MNQMDKRFTICVICYGDHPDLAANFLSSLYENTDPAAFELRAGLNEVVPATARMFAEAAQRFGNVRIYEEPENIYKNPLMRKMFASPELEDDWVIWFDDDSYPTRRDWLQRLCHRIERAPEVAQWGLLHFTDFPEDDRVIETIRGAEWFRDVPLEDAGGGERYRVKFSSGGFWAMRRSAIQTLDWPDRRLLQAAEDILLGAAMHQAGLGLGPFDYGLAINSEPRRNASAFGISHIMAAPAE